MAFNHLAKKLREFFNIWGIRTLILLSLSLQIILILFGSRRKYIPKYWISILVWSAYLAADWVATITLSNLATNQGDSRDNSPNSDQKLQAFWAPFLLLHLGGPDTITAFSLEDNELWLRHFLGFVTQVGVAFYVFVLSWSHNFFTFLTIPVFIIGIIKYGERTWVLWSSSTEGLKDYVIPKLIRRPSFNKLAEDDLLNIKLEVFLDSNFKKEEQKKYSSLKLLIASFLFTRFARLFAGQILSCSEMIASYEIVREIRAEEAFNLVAIELGLMYDVLYTKATIVYSRVGVVLHCISFFFTIIALVVFSMMIHIHSSSPIDISISYMLLVGAVVLEVYAFILHFSSDWTKLYLTKFRRGKRNIRDAINSSSYSLWTNHKRWSRSIGQFNMISFCLEKCKPTTCNLVPECLEKYLQFTWEDVTDDLQEMIFGELKGKVDEGEIYSNRVIELVKEVLARRGNYVLQKRYNLHNFSWVTDYVDFNSSILVWHIATDICYDDDIQKHGDAIKDNKKCKISKLLSNYLSYLLFLCPSMMPKWFGELKCEKTCSQTLEFFRSNLDRISNQKNDAYKKLLEKGELYHVDEDMQYIRLWPPLDVGCLLASELQSLRVDEWSKEKKWRMISEIWCEMLTYAANKCEWREHAQQLNKGGELLTHVRLLMEHLGLSELYSPFT